MKIAGNAVVRVIKKYLPKQLQKGREWVKTKILCERDLFSWFFFSALQICF